MKEHSFQGSNIEFRKIYAKIHNFTSVSSFAKNACKKESANEREY